MAAHGAVLLAAPRALLNPRQWHPPGGVRSRSSSFRARRKALVPIFEFNFFRWWETKKNFEIFGFLPGGQSVEVGGWDGWDGVGWWGGLGWWGFASV